MGNQLAPHGPGHKDDGDECGQGHGDDDDGDVVRTCMFAGIDNDDDDCVWMI